MGQHDVPVWKVWAGISGFTFFLMAFIQLVAESPKNIWYGCLAGVVFATISINLKHKANKNDQSSK